MHARVTSLSGSASELEGGIENFASTVVPFAREQGRGAILLVNRQSGEALAITLWEDEHAMAASEERANALRADAAQELGVTGEPTVNRYEVAIFEV